MVETLCKVGVYTMTRARGVYALVDVNGRTVGTYGSARAAQDAGVSLIAAAYKARAK